MVSGTGIMVKEKKLKRAIYKSFTMKSLNSTWIYARIQKVHGNVKTWKK
jgi:hypothetical protein